MSAIRFAALTAVTLAAVPALASAPAAGDASMSTVERVWWAQGLTHPMVVHIPIALLLAGAIAAVFRVVFRRIPISIVYYCLLIGALGAIPSVLAGWAWAPQKDSGYLDPWDSNSDIFWHRWGGIGVTVISLAVLVWATIQLRRKARFEKLIEAERAAAKRATDVGNAITIPAMIVPGQFGWQFAVVLLAGAMGWVAHDGGELVYPNNFENILKMASGEKLPKHIEDERKRLAKANKTVTVSTDSSTKPAVDGTTTPSTTQPATGPAVPVTPVASGDKIDFASQVWPIFVDKCLYCHNAEKDKGKLRMHTEELSLKGGSDGPLYVKGKSEESLLIQHIITDDEDEVMPPPKENKKVTEEELKILRAWVNQGAVWAPVPPSAQ